MRRTAFLDLIFCVAERVKPKTRLTMGANAADQTEASRGGGRVRKSTTHSRGQILARRL